MARRSAQAGLILLLVGLLLGWLIEPAQAHARLVRSDPPDNSVLVEPPEKMQLWFSEPITAELSSIRLLDLEAQPVEGLRIVTDPAQPTWMEVHFPPLRQGVYSLNWKVFSAVDGHYNQGVLVFGIGTSADLSSAVPSGEQAENPPVWEVVARWLNYISLAAWIGALGLWGLVLKGLEDSPARKRLSLWMALSAGIAWLAGLGLLASQMQLTSSLAVLLNTRWGILWVMRQAILLIGVALSLALYRSPLFADGKVNRVHWMYWLLLILGIAVMALQALNSHAAGVAGDPALPLLADGLHLVSIGLWAGGVMGLLVLAVKPQLLTRVFVQRFTPLAILWVGLTFASGLFSSSQQVASLDALFFTPYGQVLLLKVGVVMLVGLMGLINLRIAKLDKKGSSESGKLWRFIAVEGALMAVVLALTGLLTSSAPANTIENRLAGVQQPELLAQTVDDVLVSFSVRPNRPGQNIITVRANSTLRPAPAEIQRVILHLRYMDQDLGETTMDADPVQGSPGQYQAGGNVFSLPGVWQVDVVVRRKGILDSVAVFRWVVFPLGDIPAPRIGTFPLAWLAWPAAGGILLSILAWGAFRGRKWWFTIRNKNNRVHKANQ